MTPLNVRIAQAMGWQVVNLSAVMLPHFILPDGEVLFFDEFTPDLDPVSWHVVERWMVETFDNVGKARYMYGLRQAVGYPRFDIATAPFSVRCEAFLQAVRP